MKMIGTTWYDDWERGSIMVDLDLDAVKERMTGLLAVLKEHNAVSISITADDGEYVDFKSDELEEECCNEASNLIPCPDDGWVVDVTMTLERSSLSVNPLGNVWYHTRNKHSDEKLEFFVMAVSE